MAELKAHDYGYTEPLIEQPQPNKSAQTPPERPEIIEVPHSPARRLKRISKLEKLIGAILFAAIIGLAVLTIYVRTDISQLEHDVSLIQAETTQQNEETTRLEQEKVSFPKRNASKRLPKNKA